jgi:site-specific DNA-methyltransferase (adenine-specific)
MEYLIRTYTNEGETVLDFTMGSGTTGVACVNAKRNFIGIELDVGYYNIAQNRINEALEGVRDGER